MQCTCEVDRLEERYPTGIGAGPSRDELEAPSELTILFSTGHACSLAYSALPPANRSIGGDTPSYVQTLVRTFGDDTVWPWVTGAFVLPMGLVDRPASLLARAGGIHGVNSGMADRVQGLQH